MEKVSPMFQLYKSIISFGATAVICLLLTTTLALSQSLYINEMMSSNSSTIEDEDGAASDWIELYYDGAEPLNLDGYGISDTYDEPYRWTFPAVTINPGEFMLIWASGKDRRNPGSPLHTNFSIAAGGEEIILTDPDSALVDELEPVALAADISIGRQPDGGEAWYFFTSPTPGSANTTEGYQELLDPVAFSHPGGFYSGQITVTLSHPDPDVVIIYTIDGSEPDPENLDGRTYQFKNQYREWNIGQSDGVLLNETYRSYTYSDDSPIHIANRTAEVNRYSRMSSTYHQSPFYFPDGPIFKGTVLRAKAVKTGSAPGKAITHTFFVSPQGAERYSLPVISFGVQPDYLFDYVKGIYTAGTDFDAWRSSNQWAGADGSTPANYHRRGDEWEYPASFELFEPAGGTVLRQEIGIRIHGAWARSHPMKSLRLYARSAYGENRFYHKLFPDMPYTEYNRAILRNSGNDWFYTMFRDAFIQTAVKHLRFDTQAYRPYIVFINGEYWGIHNMRERYDQHYLSRVYGVDPENVDILEGDAFVVEGNNQHYIETIDYITSNSPAVAEHYEYIKTRVDVDNFMDYQIAQIFAGNRDWPGNNIDYWRHRTGEYEPDAPYGHDGRWRWLMYDTEFGFGLYGVGPNHNTLALATATNGPSWPNPPWSTLLLRRLLLNQSFRDLFINRFADQLNSAFRPERLIPLIDNMASAIESEIQEHITRWKQPGSREIWEAEVNVLRQFALGRPSNVREHIRNYFNAGNEVQITVGASDPSAGRIFVNTIELSGDYPGIESEPLPWRGIYFQTVPITLTALPWPGYKFSHWGGVAGSPESQTIELQAAQNTTVTAVFELDDEADFYPDPWILSEQEYEFHAWDSDEPAGSYPSNMAFVYMDRSDPGLEAVVAGFTDGVYDLDSRTRINGLGDDGFSFINTGNEEGNPGYPGVRLGGALLALNTQGKTGIEVTWEGKTILPNSRIYNLRLQYRIGDEGPFTDVLDDNGDPVEYRCGEEAGQRELIGPVLLPKAAENKVYVQLLWRYYYTGVQLDSESGQRSQLAISEILVAGTGEVTEVSKDRDETLPTDFQLQQNYPNPFNPATVIQYHLPSDGHVSLLVYDVLGRIISVLVDEWREAGIYSVSFDASNLPGGMYIYRYRTESNVDNKRMLYVK